MLTSDEVLKIMEKDFLEAQRKRISELEKALVHSNQIMAGCECRDEEKAWLRLTIKQNTKLLEKGISL